uniref:BGL18 n=1 Tax=Arundo donax TaxID=35708 RepID=A0A0A9C9L9_ARUDO
MISRTCRRLCRESASAQHRPRNGGSDHPRYLRCCHL